MSARGDVYDAAPKPVKRKRTHRPQAERRAETHKKIVDGAVKIINRHGLSSVTGAAITKETGVSWGAAQYLFGAKHDLLVYICELAFRELKSRMSGLEVDYSLNLEERVRFLLSEVSEAFHTPIFSAAVVICEDPPKNPEAHKKLRDNIRSYRKVMDKAWFRFFEDSNIDKEDIVVMRHFAQMTISGISKHRQGEDPLSYEWRIPSRKYSKKSFEILVAGIVQFLQDSEARR